MFCSVQRSIANIFTEIFLLIYGGVCLGQFCISIFCDINFFFTVVTLKMKLCILFENHQSNDQMKMFNRFIVLISNFVLNQFVRLARQNIVIQRKFYTM